MKILGFLALLSIALLLGGCVADTIPHRYEVSERAFPVMPNATAPYEVWLTTKGSSRWVMFADVVRTKCTSAVVEFKPRESTERKVIYDLKGTKLYSEYEFPSLIGCTETFSYWSAPECQIISVSHVTGAICIFTHSPEIFWVDRKWEPKDQDSIQVSTKSGKYIISPTKIKTEPNQRLQTTRFTVPMNAIAQGPRV